MDKTTRFVIPYVLLSIFTAGYVAWAAYPAFSNFYVAVDDLIFVGNALQCDSAMDIFSSICSIQGFMRPSVNVWFFLVSRFAGSAPVGYYIANALLFMLNSLLFGVIAGKLLKNRWLGVFAAAIASVLYVYHGVLYWIAGATSLVVAFFYLLTFYLWIKAGETENRRWMIGAVIAFIYGLGAKESAVTIPLILAGYEYIYRPVGDRKWKQVGLFAGITLVYVALIYIVQLGIPSETSNLKNYYLGWNSLLNLATMPVYLLSAPFPPVAGYLVKWKVAVWVPIWLAFLFAKKEKENVLFGLTWIVFASLPFIFWCVNIWESIPRYFYLPAFGIGLIVASAFRALSRQFRRQAILWFFAVCFLFALAHNNGRAILYLRHKYTSPAQSEEELVNTIRRYWVPGVPLHTGFFAMDSFHVAALNNIYFNGDLTYSDTIPAFSDSETRIIYGPLDGPKRFEMDAIPYIHWRQEYYHVMDEEDPDSIQGD